MNITVIAVGKLKEKYWRDAIAEYSKRLSRFCRFDIIEIPDRKIPENASEKEELATLEKEADGILAAIHDGSVVYTMCVEGTEITSEGLAAEISKKMQISSHLTFIIGGSLGLSERVKSRSEKRISFGRITLPHQLMRVVLSEQLYRAFKIMNNESYHK